MYQKLHKTIRKARNFRARALYAFKEMKILFDKYAFLPFGEGFDCLFIGL
jgi:hypothetical protein